MDIHRLRILRELGDRGSVTAVAEALRVTPSAVSQHLTALQRGVGVPLTAKDGRRLVLTDAGLALAEAGAKVEQALAEADAAVEAFLDRDTRPVTVSAFHSAGLAWFGPILTALEQDDLRVHLSDEDVAQQDFPRLTADHDLVIAHRLPHTPPWPDRVSVLPVVVEPLDVALAAHHPLAAKAVLEPQDLAGVPWVSVHEGFPLAGVLDQLSALVGSPARVDHRINEFFVAAGVVRSGTALAIMPRFTAASLVDDSLVLRPVAGATLERHIDLLARPEALARRSVRRVAEVISVVARQGTRPR